MLAIRNPLFEQLIAPFEAGPENHAGTRWRWQCFSPAADVRESEQGYSIELDVPGLSDKDVEVTLEGHHLTLKGERKPVENGSFTRQERSFGAFERIFRLPEDADLNRIEAKARNGVLTVSIPRLESARAKTIAVKTE